MWSMIFGEEVVQQPQDEISNLNKEEIHNDFNDQETINNERSDHVEEEEDDDPMTLILRKYHSMMQRIGELEFENHELKKKSESSDLNVSSGIELMKEQVMNLQEQNTNLTLEIGQLRQYGSNKLLEDQLQDVTAMRDALIGIRNDLENEMENKDEKLKQLEEEVNALEEKNQNFNEILSEKSVLEKDIEMKNELLSKQKDEFSKLEINLKEMDQIKFQQKQLEETIHNQLISIQQKDKELFELQSNLESFHLLNQENENLKQEIKEKDCLLQQNDENRTSLESSIQSYERILKEKDEEILQISMRMEKNQSEVTNTIDSFEKDELIRQKDQELQQYAQAYEELQASVADLNNFPWKRDAIKVLSDQAKASEEELLKVQAVNMRLCAALENMSNSTKFETPSAIPVLVTESVSASDTSISMDDSKTVDRIRHLEDKLHTAEVKYQQEIEDSHEKLRSVNDELLWLKNAYAQASQQVLELQKQNSMEVINENDNMLEENTKLQAEVIELQLQLDQLKDKLVEAQNHLEETNVKKDELTRCMEEVQNEFNMKKDLHGEELEKSKLEYNELETSLTTMSNRVDELMQQLEVVTMERDEVLEQLEDVKDSLTFLQQDVDGNASIEQLEKQVLDISAERDQANSKIDCLEQELKNIQNHSLDASIKNSTLELSTQLSEFQIENKNQKAKLEAIQNELDQALKQYNSALDAKNTLDQSYLELQLRYDELSQKHEEEQSCLEPLRQELYTVVDELTTAKNEKEQIEKLYNEEKNRTEPLQKENTNILEELNALKAKEDERQDSVSHESSTLNNASDELLIVQEQLKLVNADRDEWEDRCLDYENDLSTMSHTIKEQEEHLSKLKSELSISEQQISMNQQIYEESRNKQTELEEKLSQTMNTLTVLEDEKRLADEKITSLQNQIVNDQHHVLEYNQLKHSLEDLSIQKSVTEREIERLKFQLEEQERIHTNLVIEKEQWVQEKISFEHQVYQAKFESQQHEVRIGKTEEQLENVRKDLINAEKKSNHLMEQIQSSETKMIAEQENFTLKIQETLQKYHDSEIEISNLQDKLNELYIQLDEKDLLIQKSTKDVEYTRTQFDDSNNELHALREEFSALKDSHTRLECEHTRISTQLQEKQEKLLNLEDCTVEKERLIHSLNENEVEKQALKIESNHLKQLFDEKVQEINHLTERNQQMITDMEMIKKQKGQLENQDLERTLNLKTLENQIVQLEREKNQMNDTNQHQIKEWNQKLMILKEENQQLHDEIVQKTTELQNLQHQLKHEENILKEQIQVVSENSRTQIEILCREKADLQREQMIIQQREQQIHHEYQEQNKQLAEIKADHSILSSKCHRMAEQLSQYEELPEECTDLLTTEGPDLWKLLSDGMEQLKTDLERASDYVHTIESNGRTETDASLHVSRNENIPFTMNGHVPFPINDRMNIFEMESN